MVGMIEWCDVTDSISVNYDNPSSLIRKTCNKKCCVAGDPSAPISGKKLRYGGTSLTRNDEKRLTY